MVSISFQESSSIEQVHSVGLVTRINVEQIPSYSKIGIDKEEKEKGQRLFIDVHVDVDSTKAACLDNINYTLSYVDIYKIVQDICRRPHSLIEALAEDIVDAILKYPLSLRAKVKVYKPHIPYPDFQGNVSVEVERTKTKY